MTEGITKMCAAVMIIGYMSGLDFLIYLSCAVYMGYGAAQIAWDLEYLQNDE